MIIDAHTHLAHPDVIAHRERYLERDDWFRQLYSHPKAKLAIAEQLIAEMDAAGVDRSLVTGFAWADMGLCRQDNEYVMDAVRRYPDRLIGFAVVNPAAGREAADEVARCAAGGLRGVGELMPDAGGYRLDDEAVMAPLVEAVTAHHLPILTHTSEPAGHLYPGKGHVTPDVVARFVRRFPGVTLICAHWGGGLPFYELMPEAKEMLANVYYDTAASLYLYDDRIFPLGAQLAPGKVLFATDYPLIGQQRFLARVRASGLEGPALDGVLGGNAARLLGL